MSDMIDNILDFITTDVPSSFRAREDVKAAYGIVHDLEKRLTACLDESTMDLWERWLSARDHVLSLDRALAFRQILKLGLELGRLYPS